VYLYIIYIKKIDYVRCLIAVFLLQCDLLKIILRLCFATDSYIPYEMRVVANLTLSRITTNQEHEPL